MTWSDLVLPGSKARATAAVTISCSKAGRFRQRLMITVRPSQMEGGLPWFVTGARVVVQLGAGEHAGLLRVVPNPRGAFLVGKTGGRTQHPMLVLADFPGLPSVGMMPRPADFDHSDHWLEITLPAWVRPPDAAPASSPAPLPAPALAVSSGRPAKRGFSMAGMTAPQAMRK